MTKMLSGNKKIPDLSCTHVLICVYGRYVPENFRGSPWKVLEFSSTLNEVACESVSFFLKKCVLVVPDNMNQNHSSEEFKVIYIKHFWRRVCLRRCLYGVLLSSVTVTFGQKINKLSHHLNFGVKVTGHLFLITFIWNFGLTTMCSTTHNDSPIRPFSLLEQWSQYNLEQTKQIKVLIVCDIYRLT